MPMESGSLISNRFNFTPTELEVLDILHELPALISKFQSSSGSLLTWGRKRKRSQTNSTSPSSSRSLALSPTPSSLPRSGELSCTHFETGGPSLTEAMTSSPTTPLSLSLSESDENAQGSNKKVSRMKMTLNLKKKKADQPETGGSPRQAREIVQPTVKSAIPENQPHVIDQMAAPTEDQSRHFQYAYENFMLSFNSFGQNVSLEELMNNRSYSRLMAAEARKRRIQICKIKNSNASNRCR